MTDKITAPPPTEASPMTPERFDAAWDWSMGREPEPLDRDDVSTDLHWVHTAEQGCTQTRDQELIVTWCGIGVEPAGDRNDDDTAGGTICPACISATVCAVCGATKRPGVPA